MISLLLWVKVNTRCCYSIKFCLDARDVLLELFEPFILSNQLKSLPPELIQTFVEHYEAKVQDNFDIYNFPGNGDTIGGMHSAFGHWFNRLSSSGGSL
jgi:hypothetical protein